jgi:Amidase
MSASLPASQLLDLDAVALAGALRSEKVSCVELMSATLDRIEALNPRFNAIVALRDRKTLLAEARALDATPARGPLHGFPIAIKDLAAAEGLPTTMGSPILKDFVADANSIFVERIRAAGAIIIGKTTPEFGLGSQTYNPVYGPTRIAYDPALSAGGSSGGAAVALALRMPPVADGSDYGGSLRNPVGWNNVYGLRPSLGRVPNDGREAWLPSMGVIGPMARSPLDLALLLSVMAGYDPREPLSIAGDGSEFAAPLEGDVRGARIAWVGDWGGALPCEAGRSRGLRTGARNLPSVRLRRRARPTRFLARRSLGRLGDTAPMAGRDCACVILERSGDAGFAEARSRVGGRMRRKTLGLRHLAGLSRAHALESDAPRLPQALRLSRSPNRTSLSFRGRNPLADRDRRSADGNLSRVDEMRRCGHYGGRPSARGSGRIQRQRSPDGNSDPRPQSRQFGCLRIAWAYEQALCWPRKRTQSALG